MASILAVLIVTSLSCTLIGCFLVLRKLSMVSDAIAHSVLLGIVLAYFITKDISSPLLILGAAIFGVLTVFSIELISSSGLVNNDDAVGIVFPLFFSLAVILITKYARNVHLDVDVVLMGEVIMTPFDSVEIMGLAVPRSFVEMFIMFVINLGFVSIFYKELKVTTFDAEFASIAGFSSAILFYGLMTLSSLTAVIAFDAVGAILVVSFLITPGASAYMVTKSLLSMIIVSCIYAIINSVLGFYLARVFDVNMAGMTATIAGITFLLTFLFNKTGLITSLLLKFKRKKQFTLDIFVLHVGNHSNSAVALEELGFDSIGTHLNWSEEKLQKISSSLIKHGVVEKNNQKKMYTLTDKGHKIYKSLKISYGV